MPPVRSFPRSVTVLHPAPYALPVGSSLEVEMPLPLVQSTSAHASSSRAGASAGGDFSPERIRAAARKLARKEGRMLVDEAELNAGVMGRGGPGEVSTIKSVKGAQDWNRLLCWARKRRGPQWDACTQMYHVDYLSPEYYNPPAPLKAASRGVSRPPGAAALLQPGHPAQPQNPAVIQPTTSANRPSRRKARGD